MPRRIQELLKLNMDKKVATAEVMDNKVEGMASKVKGLASMVQ